MKYSKYHLIALEKVLYSLEHIKSDPNIRVNRELVLATDFAAAHRQLIDVFIHHDSALRQAHAVMMRSLMILRRSQ